MRNPPSGLRPHPIRSFDKAPAKSWGFFFMFGDDARLVEARGKVVKRRASVLPFCSPTRLVLQDSPRS